MEHLLQMIKPIKRWERNAWPMSVEMSDRERQTGNGYGPMGWNELVEDLVGVNLRGLRTLAAAFTTPAKLFTAARSRDWQGVFFSPSVRVYIFLIAVVVFFQFIWADASSPSVQGMREQLESLAEVDPRLDDPELVERVMDLFAVVFPIASLLLTLLASLLVRIWGAGTPLLVRIRLYFVAILPSTLFQLFGTVGLSFVPTSFAGLGLVIALLAYWAADMITAYRGLAPVHSRGRRIWRSLLFGLVNTLVIILASIVSGSIAGNWEIERLLAEPA